MWLEIYLARRRWKERDLFRDRIVTKSCPFKETVSVLRDPVKGFAGWQWIFCDSSEEHCAWRTPIRLPQSFLDIDPFLTIFMPLESWDWELSNGINIIKNGHILRKLWTDRENWSTSRTNNYPAPHFLSAPARLHWSIELFGGVWDSNKIDFSNYARDL